MIPPFEDGAQWNEWARPVRCALKLVKLATGTFETQTLGQPHSGPSWTSASASSTSPRTKKSRAGWTSTCQLPSRSRTSWVRPWRQDQSCRKLYWKRAGIAAPKSAPTQCRSPPVKCSTSSDSQHVEDTACPKINAMHVPMGYATKYFGVVNGSLAVTTKVDKLEHRPPVGTSTWVCESDRSGASWRWKRGPGREKRLSRRGRQRPISSCPYDRLPFSAQRAPRPKPIEAPDPPPWSGSKLRESLCYSDVPLSPQHSRISAARTDVMNVSDVDLATSESPGESLCAANLTDSILAGKRGGSNAASDLLKETVCGDPWVIPHDEAGSPNSCPAMLCAAVSLEASETVGKRPSKRVATHSKPTCDTSRVVVYPLPDGNPSHEGEFDDTSGSHFTPRPELYDVWIAHNTFHGKAFTSSKRRDDETATETTVGNQMFARAKRANPNGMVSIAFEQNLADHVEDGQRESGACQAQPGGKGSLSSEKIDGRVADKARLQSKCLAQLLPCLKLDGEVDKATSVNWCDEGLVAFDYAERFSWRNVAKGASADVGIRNDQRQEAAHVNAENIGESLSHEKRAVAAERARLRSEQAIRLAVGRIRAPQSIFNSVHRTPSRPEMRRFVTHGKFSPVGRKLWRRSEGLSPRRGHVCLLAMLPPPRAVLPGLNAGDGGDKALAPQGSVSTEESHWGETIQTDNRSSDAAGSHPGREGGVFPSLRREEGSASATMQIGKNPRESQQTTQPDANPTNFAGLDTGLREGSVRDDDHQGTCVVFERPTAIESQESDDDRDFSTSGEDGAAGCDRVCSPETLHHFDQESRDAVQQTVGRCIRHAVTIPWSGQT